MSPNEFPRFVNLMRGMGRIFSNEIDNVVLDVYWVTLRGWTLQEFEAAVGHLMATAKFMPRPGDFAQLRTAGKPTADEAWRIALDRCKDWRTPRQTQDAIDETAAGIGGYRSIAMADIETALPHVQRRFLEAYAGIAAASEVRSALPTIAPTPELPAPRSNSRDGRFAAIAAPAPAPRSSNEPTSLAGHSRTEVTAWLQKVGQR
jgi:hypothetical protein